MAKVVMTGKWIKAEKRWSTVVAMPVAVNKGEPDSAGQALGSRKQPKPARVLSYRPRNARGK